MSAQDRPPAVGELVVRNGKKAGTRVPLTLPVTLIGRGVECDVKLSADAVGDLHCLITATPAGPVLRSWHPDHTLVNGTPTAASVLADGDELKVGPCLFAFHWNATAVEPPTAKPELSPDLLAQLAEAREQFRKERDRRLAETAKEWAALADEKAELDRRTQRVQKLREQAQADREKSRQVYRRFLKRMKAKWSAERKAADAEREHLSRDQAGLTAKLEQFAEEQERRLAQMGEYKSRLSEAWELLAENQRRLLADRQQAEAWLAERTQALERQSRLLDDRESRIADNTATLESRVKSLMTEIAGLEARAANTRAVLRQLEQQRTEAEAKGTTLAVASVEQLAVTLEPQRFHPAISKEADRLLTELNESTKAAGRERAKLTSMREQLDREADDLADQRAVLAEQVATLAAARDLWRSSEHTTVVELEELARAVRGREQAAEERERGLAEAERERRQREYDLWQLQVKLEGWQAALAAHEVAAAADRDRADAELDTRREHLSRWEASLESVQRAWAGVREREKEHLHAELQYWADARENLVISCKEADRTRDHFLAEAEKLAVRILATEEQGGAEPRRMRVIRKRWESHFARFRKELDARKVAVAVESAWAEERLSELRRLTAEVAAKQSEQTERELTADRERIAADRAIDEQAVTLSIQQARRQRGERELNVLRTEIARLSGLVLNPLPEEAEVIPLALPKAA